MAVQRFAVTASLLELVGGGDWRDASARVETNLAPGAGVWATGGELGLGDGWAEISSAGVVKMSLVDPADPSLAVTGLQYTLIVTVPVASADVRSRSYRWGPFAPDSDGPITQWADQFDTPALTPQWRDGFRAEMDGVLAAAEAARDEAHDLSQIDTPDALVKALVEDGGSLTAGALSATIGLEVEPVRQGLPILTCQHVTASTPDIAAVIPLASLGGYIYARTGSTLQRSASETGPWVTVKAFGGSERVTAIEPTGDGEVVVAQRADGVWRSTGWATNPLTATWTKVLTTNAPVEQFSITTEPGSGRVGVTTYISGADMSLSRYMWLSTNHGQAFTVVYDKTVAHPEVAAATSHMHHVSFDPYWDGALGYRPNGDATTPRVWAVWHKTSDDPTVESDPKNFVMYSDNNGGTWTEYTTLDHHGVVAIATLAGMVMDTDFNPTALYLVKRGATVADMPRSLLYRRRPTTATANTAWGWGMKAIRGSDGMVHVAMRSSQPNLPGGVITTDGVRATETLTVNATTATDAVDVVGFTLHHGRLLLSAIPTTTTDAGKVTVVRADVPARGATTPEDNGISGGRAGDASVAIGMSSALAFRSVAAGHGAVADFRDSVAIGQAASVADHSAVAIGQGTKAGQFSTVVGQGTASASPNVTAMGSGITVSSNGTALGRSTLAGSYALALGISAAAAGTSAVAAGRSASAGAVDGVALGRNAVVSSAFAGSVAIGSDSAATAAAQVAVGQRHFELLELTADPTAPANSGLRLYVKDDGTTGAAIYARTATGVYKLAMAA